MKRLSGLIIILGIIILIFFYVKARHIHDVVTMGEGYGIKIGSDKIETINQLAEINDLFFFNMSSQNENDRFIKTDELIKCEVTYKEEDAWSLYYDRNSMDIIKLYFDNDKLAKIVRSRRTFELP